jgi:hypothetical protein
MTIKDIIGTLFPTNPQAVTSKTANKINEALHVTRLSGAFKLSPAWNHGILIAKSHPEDTLDELEIMSQLRELIHSEGVVELALEGTLIIKTDNKDHFKNEFRVRVEAGDVSCEEVKFSHLFGHNKPALIHALYWKQR